MVSIRFINQSVKTTETESIEYVKEFIKLNTPVTSIRFWNLNVDFSQELKINHNLIDCGSETLWSRYYLERNMNKSKVKSISKVKGHNIHFHFQ
jgi:hypothetical protein